MFGRIVILWQIIPIGVKLNRQEKNMEAKIVFGKPITIQLQDGMMRLVSGSIMPMVMGNNMLCVNLRIKHLSSIFIEIRIVLFHPIYCLLNMLILNFIGVLVNPAE